MLLERRRPGYGSAAAILVRAFTMTQLATPAPDAVSELLSSVSVRSTVFCLSELRAPWEFRVEDEQLPKFHLVLEGSATLVCAGEPPIALEAGELVVLPRGAAHALADDRSSPAIARLLCGGFSLAEGVPDSTLAVLPDVLRVDAATAPAIAWIEPVLAALNSEADAGLPGATAIVAKIADVLLAQALRAWLIEAEPGALVAVGPLDDQPIAKAVEALSSRPAEAWSLDRLARHVGLSRTALAVKFRDRLGVPPMRYLTKVRLSQAAAYLATGHLSIQEIARLTGYQNDAALSKAFKREFGQAPGAYRDRARRLPDIEIEESGIRPGHHNSAVPR
jgi:AraC-like DNA-binding protein/mannose-6-phosphate isomerase-like protein (cupin superfamily)